MNIPFFSTNSELRKKNQLLKNKIENLRNNPSSAKNTILNLRDGILVIDKNGNIEYINSPFAKRLGINRNEYKGKPLQKFDDLFGSEKILVFLYNQLQKVGYEIKRSAVFKNPKNDTSISYVIKVLKVDDKTQILFEDHTDEQNIDELFKRYVPPEVVEQIKQQKLDPFSASLRDMTVIFADLRGFSTTIEKMPPTKVRLLINDFFSAMVEVVNRHQGTLDKFIGDGLMVLFGAPVTVEDHASRAINTAIGMQKAHASLLLQWEKLGLPNIPLGVGINSGKMVVGNIGSSSRMDYTALGHSVNIASRICDNAKGGEILISENSYILAGNTIKVNNPTMLKIHGIKEPSKVYSVKWN